jgi:FAD/FMN-containing dehydrogenase
MYAGAPADGERALEPIRAVGPAPLDAFGPVSYAELQRSIDDPPGYRNYWTAEQLPDLPDEVIDLIHARALAMPGSAPQIFAVAWGGEVARREAGPLAGRDAAFVVHPLMMWDDPADDADVIAWGRDFRAALRDHATGVTYLNFTGDEGAERVRSQFRPGAYERLARIKAHWDPRNVFRGSGNIGPVGATR